MKELDARGLKCPQPVIETKKLLNRIEEGEVLVIVDNEIAKENVVRLVSGLGMKNQVSKEDANYHIIIKKTRIENDESLKEDSGTMIVITSEKIGIADNELGGLLMQSYLYALAETNLLPKAIAFLNSGVKLNTKDSACIESVKKLKELGVEIINCGTCIDFYGLQESMGIGIVSNMYDIIEKMNQSGKVINIG